MQSCYVSGPFGTKRDLDGRQLDFEYMYRTVLRPAVQELHMDCQRLDELSPGAIWHKTLLTALISSDLMIADLSTHNANVLYELGVRHAMRRGRTLLISVQGRLPGNLGYAPVLWYEPDQSGRLTGDAAVRFREVLQAAIRQSQHTTISDSPIYEFFPDLQIILPPELEGERRVRRAPQSKRRRQFAESVVESPAEAIGDLEKSEQEVRSAPQADPVEYLNLLRKFRDLSEWDRVISLAEDAPLQIALSPEVQQLLALALNRRAAPGDQDRAITLMENLVAHTGGDGETFGILGRIYKDRYEKARSEDDPSRAAANLEEALRYYRAGFDKNPNDYYPGVNVVSLLMQRDDEAAKSELEPMVRRVRAALDEKREAGRLDFWEVSTDLQLAAVARDWPAAERAATLISTQAPPAWMLQTTIREVRAVREKLNAATDRNELQKILAILQEAGQSAEISE